MAKCTGTRTSRTPTQLPPASDTPRVAESQVGRDTRLCPVVPPAVGVGPESEEKRLVDRDPQRVARLHGRQRKHAFACTGGQDHPRHRPDRRHSRESADHSRRGSLPVGHYRLHAAGSAGR